MTASYLIATATGYPSSRVVTCLLALYAATLAGLCYFGLHRIKMLWLYLRHSRRGGARPAGWTGPVPQVCVQCPVYNEPLMVVALLEKMTALRWPADRLEIQVLDDSTDGTSGLISDWLRDHPGRATRVVHLRRGSREGYKAGALAAGMQQSGAEFFAVFDADFRPEPDFLDTLMPYFGDPGVGVVQARWEFNNREASWLTRFQALFLDAHFIIEQAARHAGGLFFNFNGTAGIWRRAALDAAGGWTADTVTEDLDASYRAQLQGWRFVYLGHYAVPSELPENLLAFKSQQRRWTKGGMQVARKLLGPVLASNQPGRVKREAFCHLTIGMVHVFLMLFAVLFVPVLFVTGAHASGWLVWFNPVTVLLTGGTTVAFYVTGQYFRNRRWREGLLWLAVSPLAMAMGLALSLNGCVAVLEGLLQRGGEFVRTPKGTRRSAGPGGLLGLRRSRTHFGLITLGEVGLGSVLLLGAVHFGRQEMLYVSAVLLVKAVGFLALALISSQDLLPRPVPQLA